MIPTSVLRMSLFTCLTLLSFSVISVEDEQALPPILDYYPDCPYHIIKLYKAGKKTDDPQSAEEVFKSLGKLREEAQRVGADALILIDKVLAQVSHPRSTNERQVAPLYRLSYQAELIKNCSGLSSKQGKLAPYNHQGKINLRDISTTIYRPALEITLPERDKLNHPEITDVEVSIDRGIYGLPLGSSYLTVLASLGEPSAEVLLLDGELIVGYGRRHWLHFQKNKLVKVHNHSTFLSSMILNSVPLRDFFDDYGWKINNTMAYRSTLEKIRETLKIQSPLDKNGRLRINKDGSTLILHFDSTKDLATDKKIHILNNFTLQTDAYAQQTVRPKKQARLLYRAVQQAYRSLQQEQDINWQTLANELEEPIAKVTLSVDEELRIYNNNLLINTKKSQVTSIHFVEQALLGFNPQNSLLEPWYLGNLVQGKSSAELANYFLQNASSYENEVEMEGEKYGLLLFFEDVKGKSSLYEAKLEIH